MDSAYLDVLAAMINIRLREYGMFSLLDLHFGSWVIYSAQGYEHGVKTDNGVRGWGPVQNVYLMHRETEYWVSYWARVVVTEEFFRVELHGAGFGVFVVNPMILCHMTLEQLVEVCQPPQPRQVSCSIV